MMVATLIGVMKGVPDSDIREAIVDFEGIEHRLEEVRRLDGVLYVNDSKATTVDSLMFALRSFHEPVVLIAGGKDKGGDFRRVNPLLKEKVRAVVLIGQAAERMAEAWKGVVPLHRATSLPEAVQQARQIARPGEVVLLSPACSSFDMFRDYEDRGRQFKEIVQKLPETAQ
jgi:UDP-N-acetylmuramoylalanine--D-glutamate ligase